MNIIIVGPPAIGTLNSNVKTHMQISNSYIPSARELSDLKVKGA